MWSAWGGRPDCSAARGLCWWSRQCLPLGDNCVLFLWASPSKTFRSASPRWSPGHPVAITKELLGTQGWTSTLWSEASPEAPHPGSGSAIVSRIPRKPGAAPPPEPPSGPLEPRGPVLRSSAEETQEHQRLRPSGQHVSVSVGHRWGHSVQSVEKVKNCIQSTELSNHRNRNKSNRKTWVGTPKRAADKRRTSPHHPIFLLTGPFLAQRLGLAPEQSGATPGGKALLLSHKPGLRGRRDRRGEEVETRPP